MSAPRFRVPEALRADYQALSRIPAVAAAPLTLLVVAVLGTTANALGFVLGHLSAPLAVALGTALFYGLFTVIHDAIHGSFARSRRWNDALGGAGLLLLAPHATLGLFRFAHMRHHKHTNAAEDPDRWSHEGGVTLPLRWLTIDIAYAVHVLRRDDAAGRRELRRAVPHVLATVAAITLLCALGHGREVLVLWLLPSRLTFLVAGCLFFWLPHVGAETTAAEDVLRSTTLRLGHEWLLGPLLQGQNYHLIHHLFPSLPSARHGAVYRLLRDHLAARPLLIQRGFLIRPDAPSARSAA